MKPDVSQRNEELEVIIVTSHRFSLPVLQVSDRRELTGSSEAAGVAASGDWSVGDSRILPGKWAVLPEPRRGFVLRFKACNAGLFLFIPSWNVHSSARIVAFFADVTATFIARYKL